MTLRFVMAMIACVGISLTLARADGMPEPEDRNFNPVPSIPGVPGPGVPATPQKPAKPIPVPAPAPAPAPAPIPAPAAPISAPGNPLGPVPSSEPAPAVAPPASSQRKNLFEVVSIDVQIGERQPPFANVIVRGVARTGGWKNVELEPLPTFAREVGMRSFKLVGTSPDGPATQALTPVTASIRIDPIPDDVKTIRVLGETNEVAQTFR